MPAKINMLNKKFTYLTVIQQNGLTKFKKLRYLCLCKCGNTTTVDGAALRSGATTSCGCRHKEIMTTHADCNTPEYTAYNRIKYRVTNINSQDYKHYGARGITLSKPWNDSYLVFLKDMGRRPSLVHSIERIDNNKGYSKENCKWATKKEQSNNRRNIKKYTYKNKLLTITEWAKLYTIKFSTLYNRIHVSNMTIKKALHYGNKKTL